MPNSAVMKALPGLGVCARLMAAPAVSVGSVGLARSSLGASEMSVPQGVPPLLEPVDVRPRVPAEAGSSLVE